MAEEERHKEEEERYPGGSPVLALGIYALVGYMLLMTLLIFTALVVLWPPVDPAGKVAAQAALEGIATPTPTPSPTPAPSPTPTPALDTRGEHERIFNGRCTDVYRRPREGVSPLNIPFMAPRCVYNEDRLLLIVLFAGALGGMVYALRSLVWYIGNRSLKWSWSALYFLTPFASAAVALVFYFVVRGGFFSPTSSVSDTSPFGFAALAALIGMFTEQAINKLRSVAETLLAGKEQGKDHVGPAPVVTSILPAKGPTSGGTPVDIVGENFRPGVAVTFGGSAATIESVDAKLIKVKTPEHAAGKVEVVVKNDDDQQHVSKDGFEYKDEQATGEPAPPPPPPAPPKPAQPTITGVEPNTGNMAGGTQVKISGTNFVDVTSVTFDGLEADDVVAVDASTIQLRTPFTETEGPVEVIVTAGGGSSSPAEFIYTAEG
jgi:hypothetical protein